MKITKNFNNKLIFSLTASTGKKRAIGKSINDALLKILSAPESIESVNKSPAICHANKIRKNKKSIVALRPNNSWRLKAGSFSMNRRRTSAIIKGGSQ